MILEKLCSRIKNNYLCRVFINISYKVAEIRQLAIVK